LTVDYYKRTNFDCEQKRLDEPKLLVGCPDILDAGYQLVTNEGSVKVEDDFEANSALPPVSNFQCSLCTLSFSNRSNLTRHSRTFHNAGGG